MLDLTDAHLAEIARELGSDDARWSDSLNLEFLLQAAQRSGFLTDLEIHQLIGSGRRDDRFLVTLDVAPGVVLCSHVIRWDDVRSPDSPTGGDSIKHVLARLDEIARALGEAFNAEALLRDGPERERERELA